MSRRLRGGYTGRRASAVKVTRSDGSTLVVPAYPPREARRIVRESPDLGPPPPWLTARTECVCPVCDEWITTGDRIDMRGWEARIAIHHHCAPHWRPPG